MNKPVVEVKLVNPVNAPAVNVAVPSPNVVAVNVPEIDAVPSRAKVAPLAMFQLWLDNTFPVLLSVNNWSVAKAKVPAIFNPPPVVKSVPELPMFIGNPMLLKSKSPEVDAPLSNSTVPVVNCQEWLENKLLVVLEVHNWSVLRVSVPVIFPVVNRLFVALVQSMCALVEAT